MNPAILAGIVRHVLTAGGGVLVTLGMLDEGLASNLVESLSGAVMAILGIIWSMKAKEKKEVR